MPTITWIRYFCGLVGVMLLQSACAQNNFRSTGASQNIAYLYVLSTDHNPKLCTHMRRVLNSNFRSLWKRDPLLSISEPGEYSAFGKYAFPKLPGVQHDPRIGFQLAVSKIPSAPEFEQIQWKEGRITTGAPAGVQVPESSRPLPMLLAYFDFDNDGRQDTVMKYGFANDYASIWMRGESDEYLTVWRGIAKDIPLNASLWVLQNDVPLTERPITFNGQYLRPLIHQGQSYVAQYEMKFADPEEGRGGLPKIVGETMSILRMHYTETQNEPTRPPQWMSTAVCEYDMQQNK